MAETPKFRKDLAMHSAWKNHRLKPFPWQIEALDRAVDALCDSRKGIVRAATGAGKSIVQTELCKVLLDQLLPNERIVVSVPTQDLVDQMMLDMAARMPGQVGRWYEHERRIDRPVIVACHPSMYKGDAFCAECDAGGKRPWPLYPLKGTALKNAAKMVKCQKNSGGPCPTPNMLASLDEECLAGALRKKELSVRLWIADEAHKTETRIILTFEQFAKPQSRIGFTATPFRADVNERLSLFEEEIFEYGITRAILDQVIVPPRFIPYRGAQKGLDDACIEMIRSAKGPGIVNAWDIPDAIEFAAKMNGEGISCAPLHNKVEDRERAYLLSRLERGEIRCLVHINLLAEGRNFPWLRWICLRRSSSVTDNKGDEVGRTIARTRFIQEVGRALRAYPGKQYAVIFDPNNLWGELTLSYEAILGLNEEEVKATRLTRRHATIVRQGMDEVLVSPIGDVEEYIMDRAQVFRTLGMMPFERIQGADARAECTEEQYGRLKRLLVEAASAQAIPKDDLEALRIACRVAALRMLRRGALHDLLGMLHVLRSFQRWPSLKYDDEE